MPDTNDQTVANPQDLVDAALGSAPVAPTTPPPVPQAEPTLPPLSPLTPPVPVAIPDPVVESVMMGDETPLALAVPAPSAQPPSTPEPTVPVASEQQSSYLPPVPPAPTNINVGKPKKKLGVILGGILLLVVALGGGMLGYNAYNKNLRQTPDISSIETSCVGATYLDACLRISGCKWNPPTSTEREVTVSCANKCNDKECGTNDGSYCWCDGRNGVPQSSCGAAGGNWRCEQVCDKGGGTYQETTTITTEGSCTGKPCSPGYHVVDSVCVLIKVAIDDTCEAGYSGECGNKTGICKDGKCVYPCAAGYLYKNGQCEYADTGAPVSCVGVTSGTCNGSVGSLVSENAGGDYCNDDGEWCDRYRNECKLAGGNTHCLLGIDENCREDARCQTGSTPNPSPSPSPSPSPVMACTGLTHTPVTTPIIGSVLTFTCAGSVTPATAGTVSYKYRYSINSGAYTAMTSNVLTIAACGTYSVQCQACATLSGVLTCDPVWTGATP